MNMLQVVLFFIFEHRAEYGGGINLIQPEWRSAAVICLRFQRRVPLVV